MTVVKFNRQVARYHKAMKERIERRIEQLEQEKEEIRVGLILRNAEIDGQIQALRDVLVAMGNEQAPQEPAA